MKIPQFDLERYFAAHEFSADYLLCSSDCESLSISELLDMEEGARNQFEKEWLGYTESQGSPSLRKEICRLYDTMAPEHVLVHTGAEEAIFLFMQAVLTPEDHVIVHWPCYQSLIEIPRSIGCRVSLWQARRENEWALDLDALRQQIRPDTKAIVVNVPHNPTGYLMAHEAFKEVNRIAQNEGILLFCDEVYRESEYRVSDRLPAACDFGEHAVSLGVMSKTYGLAGLRIGWVATRNTAIYSRMASLKDYTTICNSAPSEFLAELALRHREKLIARNVGIMKENLSVLDDFFWRHADLFEWQKPSAGPIAFPGLKGKKVGSFCNELLQNASVLLLPGELFGIRDNRFRIGFGRKNLPQAIERLDDYLKNGLERSDLFL